MIRCVALDLDDTLLSSDLTISSENQAAIRKATQAGIKVLLASGRMVQSMKPYAKILGLDLPLIAYNGAIVQEADSGKILYHRPVSSDLALRVVAIFREAGIHLNAYLNDELYMDQLTEYGQIYAGRAGVVPHAVGDLCPLLMKEAPHKLLGFGEVEEIDNIQLRLIREFGDSLEFVKSKPTYLEILTPGVSKGSALQTLVQSWGMDCNQVMAIGDAPNDVSMIRWAGVGVAIGNAAPELKEVASFVVADHDHHGVAEAMEKIIFVKL